MSRPRKSGSKDSNELEAFEATTSGIGKKLLMKMGWNEGSGLGKEGAGIVNPIEVSMRAKGTGLGFQDEERIGLQHKSSNAKKSTEDSIDETPFSRPWKKGHAASGRYYEHVEIQARIPSTDTSVGKIIDMTGTQAKELTSWPLSLAAYHAHDPLSHGQRLSELTRSLHNIVRQAGLAVERNQRLLQQEQDRLKSLSKDIVEAENVYQKKRLELNAKRELLQLLERARIQSRILVSSGDFSSAEEWGGLLDVGADVARHYGQSGEIEVVRLFLAAFNEPLRLAIAGWSPIKDPAGPLVVFRQIKEIWAPFDNDQNDAFINPGDQLLAQLWLPPVRSLLASTFDPTSPQTNLLDLLLHWTPVLPDSIRDDLFDLTIWNKVGEAIEAARESRSLHSWIAEWRPLLKKDTFALVRRKVLRLLEAWTPASGEAGRSTILEWKGFLPIAEMDVLLTRGVQPKLASYLHRSLVIDPATQDVAPLALVLEWADVLEPHMMYQILRAGLFPKLRATLHAWMASPEADFEEIGAWYEAWKGILPKPVLQYPGVQEEFSLLLFMINALLEDATVPLARFQQD